jgi:hypothetical protein
MNVIKNYSLEQINNYKHAGFSNSDISSLVLLSGIIWFIHRCNVYFGTVVLLLVTLIIATGCDDVHITSLELFRKNEAIPPSVSGDPWRLPVEIHAYRLDSHTAIVTVPGEFFTEFGIDLKKRSPFSNTMLIELSDADIAYMPTIQVFTEGGYETLNSRQVPGSGEKMIDVAIQMLTELKTSQP